MEAIKGALPGFVVNIIGYVVTGIGIATANPFLISAGLAMMTAGNYMMAAGAIAGLASYFFKKKPADLTSTYSRQNLTINPRANALWAFGETALGTDIIYAQQHGPNDKDDMYSVIVAAAAHEIDSFVSVTLDDTTLTFGAIPGWATGPAPYDQGTPNVVFYYPRTGTLTQAAISQSGTNFDWPADAPGLGMAHYNLGFNLARDANKNGPANRVTVRGKARKVYDPRLDDTRGGTGDMRAWDESTWLFTSSGADIGGNWALVVASYWLGHHIDPIKSGLWQDTDFSQTNMVTNGTFDADTDWQKSDAGVTISGGKLNFASASNGWGRQPIELIAGHTYTVTYTVTRTAGTITPVLGGTNGTARSTNNTFTENIVCGSSNKKILFQGAGFTGTIDVVSVKPTITANTGWVITGGQAVATGATGDLEKTITPVDGLRYKITYTITRTAGSLQPRLGGTLGVSRSTSGTYVEYIVAGSSSELIEFIPTTFTGTLDEVKIESDLMWGMGIDPDDIDWAQVIKIANICEQTVDGIWRYKVGGVIPLTGRHDEILSQLETAVGGSINKIGGKHFLWAPHDDLADAVVTIDETDILFESGVSSQASTALEDLYNTARGLYVEPDEHYQLVEYPEVREETAIYEDDRERLLELDFALVQDVEIAQRVARYRIRRSRFGATWKFVVGPKGHLLQPYSVFTLNCTLTNNDPIVCRVINMTFSAAAVGATVIECVEEDASIYDTSIALGTPVTQLDPASWNLTQAYSVTNLVSADVALSGSGGAVTEALKISWDDPGGFVARTEIQIKIQGTTDWSYVPQASIDFLFGLVSPVLAGTTYDIRARHISRADIYGPWSQISDTAGTSSLVSTMQGFTTTYAWALQASKLGFLTTNITLTAGDSYLTVNTTGASAEFHTSEFVKTTKGFFLGSLAPIVRMKIWRTGGSGWTGKLRWSTASHTYEDANSLSISDDTITGQWVTIQWDLRGNSDWTSNNIKGVQFFLGAGSADDFRIEFIVAGSIDRYMSPSDTIFGSFANLMPQGYGNFEQIPIGDASFFAASLNCPNPTVQATTPFAGTKALQLINSSGVGTGVYLADTSATYNINITPNRRWIVTARIRTSAATGSHSWNVSIKTSDGGSTSGTGVLAGTQDAYKFMAWEVDLTANALITALLRIWSSDCPTTITTAIDLVTLYDVTDYDTINYNNIPEIWHAESGPTPANLIDALGTINAPAEAGADVTLSNQFGTSLGWLFYNNGRGWTDAAIDATNNADYVALVSTGADPQFISPANLNILGSANSIVRAKVKRTDAGSSWQGDLYFLTAAHGFSASYYKNIADTTVQNEWVVLEWDMSSLTVGSTDWLTSTITQLRMDLGAASGANFDVAWIAVGDIRFDAGAGSVYFDNGQAASVADLEPNYEFEAGNTNWDLATAGSQWSIVADGNARRGNYAAKYVGTAGGELTSLYRLQVETGQNLYARVFRKHIGAIAVKCKPEVVFYDQSGALLSVSTFTDLNNTTTSWGMRFRQYIVPALAVSASLRINISSSASQATIYVDGCLLEKSVSVMDDEKIYLGDNQDIELVHNGTDSFLINRTGVMNYYGYVDSSYQRFYQKDSTSVDRLCIEIGGATPLVKLYYGGSQKLITATNGIDVTGDVGGTTIGGITEANLVDKAADETITGTWVQTGKPAFCAQRITTDQTDVAGNTSTPVTVVFNSDSGTMLFDQGSNFDTTTGIFTAPVAGPYTFNTAVRVTGITTACTQQNMYIVTSNGTFYMKWDANAGEQMADVTMTNSVTCWMDAGDTAKVQILNLGEATDVHDIKSGAGFTYFSGALQ